MMLKWKWINGFINGGFNKYGGDGDYVKSGGKKAKTEKKTGQLCKWKTLSLNKNHRF